MKRDATGEDDYLHSGEKTCELISCKYFYVVIMSVWEAVFSFAHFFCLSASYDSILCVFLPFLSLSSCFDSLKLYLHFNWDPFFPVFLIPYALLFYVLFVEFNLSALPKIEQKHMRIKDSYMQEEKTCPIKAYSKCQDVIYLIKLWLHFLGLFYLMKTDW